MASKPVSVSQLNDYISRVLTLDPLLGSVNVVGEISNLKYHSSGHVYFSLKDNDSKINCFMPYSVAKNLPYELGEGLEIVASGYINVYKKGGYYTLSIRNIFVSGEGNLSLAFELLKEKLDKEGLFDQAHKKPIPKFPKKIAIVTSNTGAAVQDILKIITKRNSFVDIIIFPSIVQGDQAALDMVNKLEIINSRYKDVDTIILGRGGGSKEDLWAFNEEVLARAIYNSEIPIISAVGHEIDFSISDFVADLRAETPTAAAEIAVPDINEIREKISVYCNDLLYSLKAKVDYMKLLSNRCFDIIKQELKDKIGEYEKLAQKYSILLEENNPKNILSHGYNILEKDGKVISSINDFNFNQTYKINFKDGKVKFRAVMPEDK